MADTLLHALSDDGALRYLVATSTHLVRRAAEVHGCSPTAATAFGRLLTVAALTRATTKGDERLDLQVRADGPLGRLIARAESGGVVYGTVQHPDADVPRRDDGSIDVGAAVGRGSLLIARDRGVGEPYVGTCELATGEIGDDVAAYFATSEQIRSAVGAGVQLDDNGRVTAAGGFIVQVVGGVDEERLVALEARLAALSEMSTRIEAGLDAEGLLAALAPNAPKVLAERPISWGPPHDRAYYVSRIAGLGGDAVRELFADDEQVEVHCEFTRERFPLQRSDFPDVFG